MDVRITDTTLSAELPIPLESLLLRASVSDRPVERLRLCTLAWEIYTEITACTLISVARTVGVSSALLRERLLALVGTDQRSWNELIECTNTLLVSGDHPALLSITQLLHGLRGGTVVDPAIAELAAAVEKVTGQKTVSILSLMIALPDALIAWKSVCEANAARAQNADQVTDDPSELLVRSLRALHTMAPCTGSNRVILLVRAHSADNPWDYVASLHGTGVGTVQSVSTEGEDNTQQSRQKPISSRVYLRSSQGAMFGLYPFAAVDTDDGEVKLGWYSGRDRYGKIIYLCHDGSGFLRSIDPDAENVRVGAGYEDPTSIEVRPEVLASREERVACVLSSQADRAYRESLSAGIPNAEQILERTLAFLSDRMTARADVKVSLTALSQYASTTPDVIGKLLQPFVQRRLIVPSMSNTDTATVVELGHPDLSVHWRTLHVWVTRGHEQAVSKRQTRAPGWLTFALVGACAGTAAVAGVGWYRARHREQSARNQENHEHAARMRAERNAQAERQARAAAEETARQGLLEASQAREQARIAQAAAQEQQRQREIDQQRAASALAERGNRAVALSRYTGHEAEAVAVGIRAVGSALQAGIDPPGGAVEGLSVASMALRRALPLRMRSGERFAIEFAPDNRRALLVSEDGHGRIWDLARTTVNATLRSPPSDITAATFSSDGSKLIVWNGPLEAFLYDARSGQRLARLAPDGVDVRSAVFSRDGERVVASGSDGFVRAWETHHGSVVSEVQAHTAPIRNAAISTDSSLMVSGSDDGTARVWDTRTGQPVAQIQSRASVVENVGFSPDGTRVVTTGGAAATTGESVRAVAQHSLQLWDSRTGRAVVTIDEALRPRNGSRFSANGNRWLTNTERSGVVLWDVQTGRRVASLDLHADSLTTLDFSPDGTKVLATDRTGTGVWDANTGALLRRIDFRAANTSTSTMFSPDGAHILGVGAETADALFNADTGEREVILRGNTGGVTSVVFSQDSSRLITAGRDFSVRVWELDGGEIESTMAGHGGPLIAARFGPDGRVITASQDGTTRIWNSDAGSARWVFHGPVAEFSPDSTRIFVAGSATARINPLRDGSRTVVFREGNDRRESNGHGHGHGHDGASNTGPALANSANTRAIRWLNDGATAALADRFGVLSIWDAQSGRRERVLLEPTTDSNPPNNRTSHTLEATTFFALNVPRALVVRSDGNTQLWDLANGTVLGSFRDQLQHTPTAPALSPDGVQIAVARDNGGFELLDATTGRRVVEMGGETGSVDLALYSSDGARLLTAGADRAVQIWNTRTGQRIAAIDDTATSAAFSPDGLRVALCIAEGSAAHPGMGLVRVWDVDHQRVAASLEGHNGVILSVRFSRDGTKIVTTGEDQAARVWDAATGRTIAVLVGHGEELSTAEFSPDGEWVRVMSSSGTTYIHPATSRGVLDEACRLLRTQPEYGSVRRYCESSREGRRH